MTISLSEVATRVNKHDILRIEWDPPRRGREDLVLLEKERQDNNDDKKEEWGDKRYILHLWLSTTFHSCLLIYYRYSTPPRMMMVLQARNTDK